MVSHYVSQVGLELLGSSNPALASQSAGIIGVSHRAWLIVNYFGELRSHYVGHAGLKLPASSDLTSSSQSTGIIGMSHHALPIFQIL